MPELPLRDPVAVFTVVLLVLLAAPLVGRRGVPPSVVLLGFGIALGPHALGVLDRDPTMVLLGTVGLLYLMFLAGLEIDLGEFAAHRRVSATFGALTFALPQAVGTAVGRGGLGMEWPAAILLGSVFASHTLLAYPVVGRLGLQRARAATASVGATILTDTLALLVLAVVASGARGAGGPLEAALRVALPLAAFSGAVLWGLPRLGAWFLRTAASESALEFVFVLAAVFACALGVEALGVEPIIGAFLAGLALNRLVPEGSALMARVSFVGTALFVPFFLLATGMLVDLGAFAGGPGAGRAWLVAGAMTGTVVATKGAAAWAMRPVAGFSAAEAALAFGLTVPQAAATLAAALVGVEVGLFDAAVLNGTIAMVFVTCLAGPWVAEAAGRRLAAAAAPRAPETARRLLVSLSNPATADALLDLALLARPAGHDLAAVTVVAPGPSAAAAQSAGEALLAAAVARATAADAALVPSVRIEPNVPRGLARAAAETRAAALVMGWDGSAAAERVLFGTIPDRVLRESPAAVLVARAAGPWAAVRRLVVLAPAGTDREPQWGGAAELVARLARRLGASLALAAPDGAEALARSLGDRTARLGGAWREAPETLAQTLRDGDAVVLVAPRPGSVAWHAGLDRLPRELAQRFPRLPLLVLTPGREAPPPGPGAGLAPADRRLLDRLALGDVHAELAVATAPDAARALAPDAALGEALAASLVELRPGVALAHARWALDGPFLAVGRCRGVPLAGAAAPVRLVVALGLPASASPRKALGWLALLGRLLGPEDAVARALAAPDAEALRQVLVDAAAPLG